MGWWGFTFPLGVLTVATTTIGVEMPSKFFLVLGTVSSRDILPAAVDSCILVPALM